MKEINNEIEFSIIITCYYEEKSIEEFSSRLLTTLNKINRTYEVIFINDGSQDKTFQKLIEIYENNENVSTIIDLFRNAGQPSAMTTGITKAIGKNMVFIDSDLQLDPEDLPLLIEEFDKGYDIVSGYRKVRKDSIFRKISSKIANYFMKKVSKHSLSDYGCTFKIYDGKLIRAFEYGPFKKLSVPFTFSRAQNVKEVAINHHERKYGESGWTFNKLFSYHMENMVGMSQKPFQIISFFCILFSIVLIGRMGVEFFFPIKILKNVTNGLLLNAILINLLLIISILAIIGEYVIRIFIKTQNYPIFVIKEEFNKNNNKTHNKNEI